MLDDEMKTFDDYVAFYLDSKLYFCVQSRFYYRSFHSLLECLSGNAV